MASLPSWYLGSEAPINILLRRRLSEGRAAADPPLDTGLIAEHWDDLLRLAGSLKFGHATALIVGKLSRSDRQQNAFAAALKEYGALRRTVYAARYLTDATYRRRTGPALRPRGRGPPPPP